jgi:nitroreductase
MDALEALLTRRSVRRYTDDPVTDAELEVVLRAAMAGPSGFGQRSTRFVVVRDEQTRLALSLASKHAGPAALAPVTIVVCGDTRAEKIPGAYFVHDAVASIENLLTAAHATGLGAVWIGVHPWPERMDIVRAALELPDGVEPVATVAMGHPSNPSPPADRFDESFIHRERW